MSIRVPQRPMSDAEVRTGAAYRYFRDTNMILMNRDGKLGKHKLLRLAEEKALADMQMIMDQAERQNGQRPPDPAKSLLGGLLP